MRYEPLDWTTAKVGIVGLGSMGGALVRGWLDDGLLRADQIEGCDVDASRGTDLGIALMRRIGEFSADIDVVVVAVKPRYVPDVCAELGAVSARLFVSVAAGVTTAELRHHGIRSGALVRAMPNTAASIRRAVTAVCGADDTAADAVADATALLRAVGDVDVLDAEDLMDAATALVGSGPAFLYVLAEALADGGVAEGLPRATAQRMAAGAIAGAGALLQEAPAHAAALKDAVASPAGTTIAGLAALEDRAFRAAVIHAVRAAAARSRELGE